MNVRCQAIGFLLVGCAALLAAGATAAEPQYLLGIAVDKDQNIFLADRDLPGVWRLADGKLSLLVQGSKKFRTPLNAVRCLAIDADGQVLAGDSATRDIYRIDAQGQAQPLTKGEIGIPVSIAVNKAGEILVGDLETHRIWKVPAAGGKPELYLQIAAPRALWVDAEDRVWIISHGKDQLLRRDADAPPEVIAAGRPFEFPSAVVVDPAGTAFVCDTYAKAIWKIAAGQPPQKWFTGEPLVSPVGLAWRGENLLVSDPRAKAVIQLDPAGKASQLPLVPAE
jgi:hypothetical protein